MKKSILTLGLFAAMMLGATGINASERESCTNFTLICADGAGHIGLVCGDTVQEMEHQMFQWIEILC